MSTPIRFRVSILLTCFFALSAPFLCRGIDIATSGSGWSPSINSSTLISGPGSNLPSTLASDPAVISIDVTNSALGKWHINVRKTNGAWNSNLHISAKRTGNGSSGNLTGGTTFQEVTATDVSFFSGRGDSLGVTVGLELTGVSIQVPPNTGSTTLTFTVVVN